MQIKRFVISRDQVWIRVTSLTSVLFFIYFSDALLSYWVPVFIQDTTNSAVWMGFILGFSSIVGLLADIVLPQMFKNVSSVKLIILAAVTSFAFSGFMLSATWFPYVFVFLIGMAVWGIYYEFLGFATQQFVANSVPSALHASTWAFISTFRSLAYTLGPFVAGLLLKWGDRQMIIFAITLAVVGYYLILLFGMTKSVEEKVSFKHINFTAEVGHWIALFWRVWPVVVLSLLVGTVEAIFWTVGAVYADMLSETSWLGGLFLSVYMAPSLFMGFWVMRLNIVSGKKRKATMSLAASGLLLAMLGISDSVFLILLLVFISSCLSAFSYPLIDAVYSDVIARMGRQRLHLVGLTNSATSVSYIIGPMLGGLIASQFGEKMTFSVVGGAMSVMCLMLFFVLPKKLKLPQKQIERWK